MNKNVGIIGCGWLGTPLAKALLQKGYQVRGSTTSEEKRDVLATLGIDSYVLKIDEKGIVGDLGSFLENLGILVINIPPGLRKNPDTSYVSIIKYILEVYTQGSPEHTLFVSSTSVFGQNQGLVDEDTLPIPESEAGRQLLSVENLLKTELTPNLTIVRFGGLIGKDRHPINMLSGKTLRSDGKERINLIHLDDCLRILLHIIENNFWNQVINGVYPEHPEKEKYYTEEARKRQLSPPKYQNSKENSEVKIVKSKYILNNKSNFITSIFS